MSLLCVTTRIWFLIPFQVPGTDPPKSHLASSEVEIGMGIHNEPGHSRVSPVPPLRTLVAQLIDYIVNTNDPERSFIPFKNDGRDKVALMVNNLGGVSELELTGIVNAATEVLGERNIGIERVLSGCFMVGGSRSPRFASSCTDITLSID